MNTMNSGVFLIHAALFGGFVFVLSYWPFICILCITFLILVFGLLWLVGWLVDFFWFFEMVSL